MPRRIKMLIKIRRISAGVLLLLLGFAYPAQGFAASGAGEENSQNSQWAFSKPIELTDKAPYYELYLDEEVYGEAAGDLRDLRIVDSRGDVVPFYRDSAEAVAEEHNFIYAAQLVHATKKGADTWFDYKITPARENEDIQGNQLVFGLPGEAFLKHVQVLGGYDGIAWEPLAKGDLYSTNGLTQNRMELDTSYKFSYYRLIVENNVENLKFGTLQLLHGSTELKENSFKRAGSPDYEMKQEGNQTQIVVHNRDRLQVTRVMLDSGGNFTRQYELRDDSGRSVATEGSGELYRLNFKDARISATEIIPIKALAAPSYTIIIYNNDDAPVSISGIRTEYTVDKLVFAGDREGPYQLLYGNQEAAAPQYDIVHFKAHIAGESVVLAKLGVENAVQGTPAESPSKPGLFQSKIGFNSIVIAVSLLLIIVLIRKMNRT